MLEVGAKAPEIRLQNQDGNEVTLNGYAEKWKVLYFYPKDNTSGCTKEACDFTESIKEFEDLDAVVLGVSPDSILSHRNFIEKQKLDIDLLSDPDKKMLKAYGAWGTKKNYGKEYEGVIRSTFIISPKNKISKIWHNVKVRTKRKNGEARHVDVVKAALIELQKKE
ncbi:MAG: peroxiredoxin [Candidatus Scalindua sp. AMX11]|nr:MAG: peroxiredoxin [Candidatus Scalindua sp.]NOG84966.1 peroxiredoxin [Planctomycetota bacterium]RZV93021.1 MAG: peroxiredoxin [Candidatus Scalindua sp. SCAELEC01]TDE66641.1 MAG: peroxiredoxin [Candidatus Scalindua sp. AMX11]GJQ57949.1 MAG: peroxiredoxin [Candidatus Scalindua sp.]